jgi:hypothetical protein
MRRGLMPWRRRPWLERAVRGRLRRPSAPLLGHARCLLRNRADEALRPERPAGVCTEVWGLVPRAQVWGWGCAGSPASFRNPRDLAWPPPPRCRALRQAPPFLGQAVVDQQWWCDVAACLLAVVTTRPWTTPNPEFRTGPWLRPPKGSEHQRANPAPQPKGNKGGALPVTAAACHLGSRNPARGPWTYTL